VGEWLKPTDCKSVPPCEVRRFESFPVHQLRFSAVVAQLVERVLGKDEVTSSILVNGSISGGGLWEVGGRKFVSHNLRPHSPKGFLWQKKNLIAANRT
jgi:hypothetical protein